MKNPMDIETMMCKINTLWEKWVWDVEDTT
jgi:hypothetical protein